MKAKRERTFLYFTFIIFYLQYILVGIYLALAMPMAWVYDLI